MRWHVAALAAVWLIVLSWCGSVAQPVDGRLDKAAAAPPAGQQHRDARAASDANSNDDLWNMIDEAGLSESSAGDDSQRPVTSGVYYIPYGAPVKRLPANIDEEPGNLNWPVNPPSHFGSVGGHHFGGQMPQLSISSPIEALRNRLRLEMSRRLDNQIKQNQKLLESVGRKRRSISPSAYGTEGARNKPASVIKAP